MTRLSIMHADGLNFNVVRAEDGKTDGPYALPNPFGFQVEDRPNDDLMPELRW